MTISAGSAVTGTRWWKPECSGKWAGFLGDRKNGQQLSHVPRLTVIFMSWQGYRYYQTIDPNPAWPVLNLTLKKRQLLSLVYTDRCHRLQSVGFRTRASSAHWKTKKTKKTKTTKRAKRDACSAGKFFRGGWQIGYHSGIHRFKLFQYKVITN